MAVEWKEGRGKEKVREWKRKIEANKMLSFTKIRVLAMSISSMGEGQSKG